MSSIRWPRPPAIAVRGDEINKGATASNDSGTPVTTVASAAAPAPSWRRPKLGRINVDLATLKEVLRLIDEISPETFAGMKEHRRKVLTARSIDKARAWGICEPRDLVIFCALRFCPGEAFFERPAWLRAAERVRNGLTTWSMVFSESEIWEEVQVETKA